MNWPVALFRAYRIRGGRMWQVVSGFGEDARVSLKII
jgi:hypothetical protein